MTFLKITLSLPGLILGFAAGIICAPFIFGFRTAYETFEDLVWHRAEQGRRVAKIAEKYAQAEAKCPF